MHNYTKKNKKIIASVILVSHMLASCWNGPALKNEITIKEQEVDQQQPGSCNNLSNDNLSALTSTSVVPKEKLINTQTTDLEETKVLTSNDQSLVHGLKTSTVDDRELVTKCIKNHIFYSSIPTSTLNLSSLIPTTRETTNQVINNSQKVEQSAINKSIKSYLKQANIQAKQTLISYKDIIIEGEPNSPVFVTKGGHQLRFTNSNCTQAIVDENVPQPFSRSLRLQVKKQNPNLKLADLVKQTILWQHYHIHIYFPEKDPKGKGYVYIGTNNKGLWGGGKDGTESEKEKEKGEKENHSRGERPNVCKKDKETFKAFLREQVEQESPYKVSSYGDPPNHIRHQIYVDQAVNWLYEKYKDTPCGCENCKKVPTSHKKGTNQSSSRPSIEDCSGISVNPTPWQGQIGSHQIQIGINPGELISCLFSSNSSSNQDNYQYYKSRGIAEAQRIEARTQQIIKESREATMRIMLREIQEEMEKKRREEEKSRQEATRESIRKEESMRKEAIKRSLAAEQGNNVPDLEKTTFIPDCSTGNVEEVKDYVAYLKKFGKQLPNSQLSNIFQEKLKKIIELINTRKNALEKSIKSIKYVLNHPDIKYVISYREGDLQLANKLLEELKGYKEEIRELLSSRRENLADYDSETAREEQERREEERRKAEDARKRKEDRKKVEEEARKREEEEDKKKAEEEAQRKAEVERRAKEEAKRKAEEAAYKKAEEDRKKVEEAKRKAEAERNAKEEARRKEEEVKKKAEEAKKKAEEEVHQKEAEAKRIAKKERRRANQKARRKEAAAKKAEEKAKQRTEIAAREQLENAVKAHIKTCQEDASFSKLREGLLMIEESLKQNPHSELLQALYKGQLASFHNHPLYKQSVELGIQAAALRREAEEKGSDELIRGAETRYNISAGVAKARQYRQEADAIKETVLKPLRNALGYPNTPRGGRRVAEGVKGFVESFYDTGKAFVVDLPVLLGKVGVKGAESLIKWEDKLGVKEGCANLGKACKALFDQAKQDWEDPTAYEARMQAVRELAKRQDLFRRAFDAENYHLGQDKMLGYAAAELAQFLFGGEILKGAAKGASKGAEFIKKVQQGAKVEEVVVDGISKVGIKTAELIQAEQVITDSSAKLATNSIRLQKQLVSEMQMASKGDIIIEFSKLQISKKLVEKYGGKLEDWVKKASKSFNAKDGLRFETHWYENLKTGQRVEFKTKLN